MEGSAKEKQEAVEKDSKGKVRGAEFVVAVPTDITEVEKKAFFDIFAKDVYKRQIKDTSKAVW